MELLDSKTIFKLFSDQFLSQNIKNKPQKVPSLILNLYQKRKIYTPGLKTVSYLL